MYMNASERSIMEESVGESLKDQLINGVEKCHYYDSEGEVTWHAGSVFIETENREEDEVFLTQLIEQLVLDDLEISLHQPDEKVFQIKIATTRPWEELVELVTNNLNGYNQAGLK